MSIETQIRQKMKDERERLHIDWVRTEKLEREILRDAEKASAARHKLAMKMVRYEREEDAPKKLWNDLRTLDGKVSALGRSIDGARARRKHLREKLDTLDSPEEFERRVQVQTRLDELHEASKALREEQRVMAATSNTKVRGLNEKSRSYKLTAAEQKKVDKIANGDKPSERYAVMVIKVQRGVRAGRPGGTGLTEAREAAIDKALGYAKPVKKERVAKAPAKAPAKKAAKPRGKKAPAETAAA